MKLFFWKVVDHEYGLGAETWNSTIEEFQQEQNDCTYRNDNWWFFFSEEERDADMRRFPHKLEPVVHASYDYDKHQWLYTPTFLDMRHNA